MMGDLTKGGHPASAEELARLGGLEVNGVPWGLVLCGSCGLWRGQCLDPSPEFRGKVMTVSCLCDNRNHCAA